MTDPIPDPLSADNLANEAEPRSCEASGQPAILAAAPRCGARTRGGTACRSPAVRGAARCRMHGGRGSGAPRGNRNAWKHGGRSEWIREVSRFLRATRVGARRIGSLPCLSAFPKLRLGTLKQHGETPAAAMPKSEIQKNGRTTPCTRKSVTYGRQKAWPGDADTWPKMWENGAPGTIRTSDPQIRSFMREH